MVNGSFKQYAGTEKAKAAADAARTQEIKGAVGKSLGDTFIGAIHDVEIRRDRVHFSDGAPVTFEKVAVIIGEDVSPEDGEKIRQAVTDYLKPRGIRHVLPEFFATEMDAMHSGGGADLGHQPVAA